MKGRKKVVEGFDIFFKDDFSIVKSEIARRMELPTPYILDADELLIVYEDFLFVLSEEQCDENYMKIYTEIYGIERKGSLNELEEEYFEVNSSKIESLKRKFIENCIDVPPYLQKSIPEVRGKIADDIAEEINKTYHEPQGKKSSIFSCLGYDPILIVDEKIYDLVTIPEFLQKFKRSFEPKFFKRLEEMSKNAKPEEVSRFLMRNKDKVHKDVLPVVRDKIWCNERSGEIFLNGKYFIPEYRERIGKLADAYMRMLERKVKLDAVAQFKEGLI